MSAAIAFAMMHTHIGRGLLFVGWLFMILIIALNLALIKADWPTVKALLTVLLVGLLWFFDLEGLIGWLVSHLGGPLGGYFTSRKANKKARHIPA
jgi:hypothetical protein